MLLAGCSDFRRAIGMDKVGPDEFAVESRAPLTIPPDYDLRPPQPGATRPQETTAADKARSQVRLRASQLAYCKVSAPFGGNVARLRVKASESVNAGQPLVDLVNPASLKAQMFVPASWIAWLRPGAPLTLEVRETGQTFKALVSKINSRVDGVSQQLEVEARIEKGGGRLLPGMVGSAMFDGAKR